MCEIRLNNKDKTYIVCELELDELVSRLVNIRPGGIGLLTGNDIWV